MLEFNFTNKKQKKSFDLIKALLIKCKKDKAIKVIDYIYPLTKPTKNSYEIKDHINLSGSNPLCGPDFVPLTNIYESKNGIIVVGLKNGVTPNNKEKKILLKAGVKAYCYNLIPTAIIAASLGLKIKAVGIVKRFM